MQIEGILLPQSQANHKWLFTCVSSWGLRKWLVARAGGGGRGSRMNSYYWAGSGSQCEVMGWFWKLRVLLVLGNRDVLEASLRYEMTKTEHSMRHSTKDRIGDKQGGRKGKTGNKGGREGGGEGGGRKERGKGGKGEEVGKREGRKEEKEERQKEKEEGRKGRRKGERKRRKGERPGGKGMW